MLIGKILYIGKLLLYCNCNDWELILYLSVVPQYGLIHLISCFIFLGKIALEV